VRLAAITLRMKTFAAIISDVFFFTVCAFLICFTLTRYFFEKPALAFAVAAFTAAAACLFSLFIMVRQRRKNKAAAFNKRQLKALETYLCTSDDETVLNLFKNESDGTYALANGVCEQSDKQNIKVVFNFKFTPLTPDDAANAIKTQSTGKSTLYCCSLCDETRELLTQFNVEFLELDGIYALLNANNRLPEDELKAILKRPKFLNKIKSRFNRKLFWPLTLSGLTFLAFARFAFYPVWYRAAGCVMLTLAAVCLFFRKR